MDRLFNISELCKILNLIDKKTKKPKSYIIRYWEKEFPQLKPKKINNLCYYNSKNIETIKMIKILLKDHKLSIAGVKNILNSKIKKLDYDNTDGLRKLYLNQILKKKGLKIVDKIKKLKKYGKKNTSKS